MCSCRQSEPPAVGISEGIKRLCSLQDFGEQDRNYFGPLLWAGRAQDLRRSGRDLASDRARIRSSVDWRKCEVFCRLRSGLRSITTHRQECVISDLDPCCGVPEGKHLRTCEKFTVLAQQEEIRTKKRHLQAPKKIWVASVRRRYSFSDRFFLAKMPVAGSFFSLGDRCSQSANVSPSLGSTATLACFVRAEVF